MLRRCRQGLLALGLLSIPCALGQSSETSQETSTSSTSATITASVTSTGTLTTISEAKTPTGSYRTYTTVVSLQAADDESSTSTSTNETETDSGTNTGETSTTSSVTYLTGISDTGTTTIAGNATSSSTTSSAATATNTTPCNNYVEFCSRKYGNITEVAAHNSPFTRAGSAASNQELDVTTQLDDGIRLLQAQIQWASNDTIPHFCHTSCDILDAGPITDWLSEVNDWVTAHPFDVVTILLGNGNYTNASVYAPYIESTGINKWAYIPPHLPMALDDWPTLEEMILNQQRVVMLMDYDTSPEQYPWIIDEFNVMWETPFDPVDDTFPCTIERPPDLSDEDARNRMYMTNHNYNVEVTVFGATILVPATTVLNQTNGMSGNGSLGEGAQTCLSDWNRPPTFLNVDYYNYGSPNPGSVFAVAAEMNGVTYDWDCCGSTSAAPSGLVGSASVLVAMGAAVMVSLLVS